MPEEENITKGERTRRAVIDSAYQCFLEKGFSATSMRQIAEGAGLALGGIYNHFASKDEIFQALIIARHPFIQIFPLLSRAPGSTLEEFVHNAAHLVQQEVGNDPGFFKLMLIEIVEFKGQHLPGILELVFPMALPLVERFNDPLHGVRTSIPTPKLIRIFVGNIMAYFLTELMVSDSRMPAALRETSLEDFLDVFLYGLLDKPSVRG